MSEGMWKIDPLPDDQKHPLQIIQEQCDSLKDSTEGYIIARTSLYDGETENRPSVPFSSIFDHKNISINSSILFADAGFNVQSKLGEVERRAFVFEFFITSKKTPKYKYRAFFLGTSLHGYPVTFTLEDDIRDELNMQSETITCVSEEDFQEILRKILGSKRIRSIVTGLLSYNNV